METPTDQLRVFEIEIVTQVLTITAKDQEEAEAKYDAHFDGDACPCGKDECDCVDDSEEVYHITTEITPEVVHTLASLLEKRNEQVLATTEEDRNKIDGENPIVFAESAPNRFVLMSMFFEDVPGGHNDGVLIQEDTDLGDTIVKYFNDTESIEITEGAVYDWALAFYEKD